MATSQSLSGSVIKGQAAIHCQLCEYDPKLKWKCLDCKIMMCQRCKDKVHPKFASAEDHTIIDIKEIGQHITKNEPKPDLTKLKCGVHSGQNCCFYCETCEILVCQTCATKSHKKHEFTEITDEYEIKLEKVRDEHKNIRQEIHNLTLNEQKLKEIKLSEQSNYDKVKQEILDYDKALKNDIQNLTDKLLKELDQKWEAVSNFIDSKAKELKEEQKQITEKQREIIQLLQVDNVKDVFSVSSSMFKSRRKNTRPFKMTIKGVPQFARGDNTEISQILGKLHDFTIQINTDPQVKAQFESKLNYISSVVSCPDGSVWICNGNSGIIQKVNLKRDSFQVTANLKTPVYDAALLPSGDLLFSIFDSSNLKLIPPGSTDIQDSVYTVSQLQPTGIHIAKDSKIIIGVREIGPPLPVKGPRKVIVMDQIGNQEKAFQYDNQNRSLFTLPLTITSNSKGNIAVVDTISNDSRGQVVVLTLKGKVRNIYTGHPDVNKDDLPFKPRGITTTPSDNFVIADMSSHTLHILNSEGEIITFYNIKEMGILHPCSLSFSTTRQLYIGCTTNKNSWEQAKLFVTDNCLF